MKKSRATFLLVIFTFLLVGTLIWFWPIRQVSCFLNDHQVSADFPVCSQLQTLRGSRLLLRDFNRDEQVAQLLYVADSKETFDITNTEKSLTGSIIFYLNDRPPLYRVKQDEQLFLVTENGGLKEDNQQVIVPLVADQAELLADDQTHLFLSQFLLNLGDNSQKISQITLVSSQRVEIKLPSYPLVLVELNQDPAIAANRLQVVLNQLDVRTIDLGLNELDLRFELPVLRTQTSVEVSSDSAEVLIDSQE